MYVTQIDDNIDSFEILLQYLVLSDLVLYNELYSSTTTPLESINQNDYYGLICMSTFLLDYQDSDIYNQSPAELFNAMEPYFWIKCIDRNNFELKKVFIIPKRYLDAMNNFISNNITIDEQKEYQKQINKFYSYIEQSIYLIIYISYNLYIL